MNFLLTLILEINCMMINIVPCYNVRWMDQYIRTSNTDINPFCDLLAHKHLGMDYTFNDSVS